ncbi:cobalt/nickel transport protein [Frankia sp. EI5c]|uniref:PDGLE domain-containing protein n=1 Tax=Frankia sp. EI5c TaxID=683316 RepID=UPI0007C33F85|nr:PDGLE domain-containing protein [Frankia sp. EI5c]OAA19026.1 cobalt/nickel transport protein [Frankia sp. EI5c]OAA28030.1 cobalt/nickel transport protein [Frankia sp. EI5c]
MTGPAPTDGSAAPTDGSAAPTDGSGARQAEQPAAPTASTPRRNTVFVMLGLLVAFLLAGFVSGYASSSPDGLEKVAQDKGFSQQAEEHSFADWPLADYAVSGIANERLAGGLAGVIGVSIAYAVGGAIGLAVRARWRAATPRRRPDRVGGG